MINTNLILESFIIALSLASLIFAFGIVWRVERELDISFKLLLAAVIFFIISEILNIISSLGYLDFALIIPVAKALYALFFLAGIFTMRDLLRRMDGEK